MDAQEAYEWEHGSQEWTAFWCPSCEEEIVKPDPAQDVCPLCNCVMEAL